MLNVDPTCSNIPRCITVSEYKKTQPESTDKLIQELMTARRDLMLGRAKEFEVGSEETLSGFPVSRIEEVRQLSSKFRISVLVFELSTYRNTDDDIQVPISTNQASAFLIQPNLVITNSHNVRDSQGTLTQGKIVLHTFQGNTVEASVVGHDPSADIALLRLKNPLALPTLK
jgi:S1-C subfamily serine protease